MRDFLKEYTPGKKRQKNNKNCPCAVWALWGNRECNEGKNRGDRSTKSWTSRVNSLYGRQFIFLTSLIRG